jgi:hypothetical protein
VAFAGANQLMYPVLQNTPVDIGSSTAFLAPTGQRIYLNEGTYPGSIPAAWPTLSDPTARACVSIRPYLWELISGNLDTALQNFLTSAPGGATSLLGLWHEASGGGSGTGPGGIYKTYFDSLNQTFPRQGGAKGLLTKAQTYVQQKAQAWKANVKVGAIEVVESKDPNAISRTLSGWMAHNLDFYACDTYDFSDGSAVPSDLLSGFLTYVKSNLDSSPQIGITETNSRFPGRRPYWFTNAWSWLTSHGFTSNTNCYLTFWNTTGIESGAWIPDDWATIDALYGIFAASSP